MTLFTGDNLQILQSMDSNSIDLIATDPPYGTEKNWKDYDDRYGGIENFIEFLRPRCIEMYRVLKDTGSLYLQCDPTASHYIKIMLDSIFDRKNFRNEIVWYYGKMSNSPNNFSKNHDIILRYTKSNTWTFNPISAGNSKYKTRYYNFVNQNNQITYKEVKHKKDRILNLRRNKIEKELNRTIQNSDVLFDFNKEFQDQGDVFEIPIIRGNDSSRTGYPTQKPVSLYEKIIKASSNEEDIVLDPFCGSGTTLVAAKILNRKYIGIDKNPNAISICKKRLDNTRIQYTLK